MTKCTILPSILILAFLFVFTGCEDEFSQTYTANVPVYKSYSKWRAEEISIQNPQEISDAGRVYAYASYLLVNDRYKGLHIFDNSDPSAPVNLGFLPIHGNLNMAVQNNRMYVDSYSDMLTFDVSDFGSPKLTCRTEDVFSFTAYNELPGYDEALNSQYPSTDKVVVGWEQKEITTKGQGYNYDERAFGGVTADAAAPNVANPSTVGTGGSMAQFTISNDFLYTLETNELTSFDLSNADCPEQREELRLNRQAETIFPTKDHLFLGTTQGMLIYSLANPSNPSYVSEFLHVTACDPVVVQGNMAYVTIRSGTNCWNDVNELIVVDISTITDPQKIATYSMTNPHGLGIDDNTLFICDGADGLKIYDATDNLNINNNRLGHFKEINTYDVIAENDLLITSAEEGIYQYNYSDPANLQQLSVISVGQ